MIPILGGLVSLFAGKGLNLLARTVDSATDKGVEKITEFIKDKTGLDVTAKADLTSEEIQKLRELEMQYDRELKEIALEYYRLDLQDRASARDMQVKALMQDDVFSKRFLYYYAAISTLISFVYIFLITFVEIPEDSLRFADTILGVVIGTILSTITQFFFGSSQGSRDKDIMLKKDAKK